MKETYHVGYDPDMKLWDAQRVTHNFDPSMTVFKVTARNEHDAVQQGLNLYQKMMAQPSDKELKLIAHIVKQVGKQKRGHDDVMMVEAPISLIDTAREMERKGFFRMAYQDEIIVNMASAGWKCMSALHEREKRNSKRDRYSEFTYH